MARDDTAKRLDTPNHRGGDWPDALAFAQHLEVFESCDVRWNAGSGIVIDKPFIRGVLTAIFWLSRPKFPHATFASVDDAREWCLRRLAADRLP